MELHIGERIEARVNELGMKVPVFAEKIHTGTRNVYHLFTRADINAAMLATISKVLDYNFFQLYEDIVETRLNEPEVPYLVNNRHQSGITLSFNVWGVRGKMDQFSDFLGDLEAVAEKYQYQIL